MSNTNNWPPVYAVRQRDGKWFSYSPAADAGSPPREVELALPVDRSPSAAAIPFMARRRLRDREPR